ncbi:MAG: endolytic transglycosylase MltG [Deltaproteobacteria bacterium]|nr:endolytic transglycosylase MltG [Deltaproteobacteria bacterium]
MQFTISRKLVFAGIFCIIFFGFILAFLIDVTQPPKGRTKPVLVEIHRGERFCEIVNMLHRERLIRTKASFYLLSILRGVTHQIKAGEYEFPLNISTVSVLDKLVRGDIKRYRFVIPEDQTAHDIADRLAALGLIDREEFIALFEDKNFLVSLDIEGDTAEGFLYPETYYFDRSMGTRKIMVRMITEFWKHVTPAMQKRAQIMGFSLQEWVTLASMIGRETGHKEEKILISAVFHNRLKKGMKLQSDPTAVYNLKGFSGPIKRRHLNTSSPHNTYQIHGLPPGPIANPGLDSLQAALYPAANNFLYFVSRNNGTHFFSTDYASHNKAVKKYQVNGKKE